jgi:hypothetical protein|eukprot:5010965-Prymnesium_polylepis.2
MCSAVTERQSGWEVATHRTEGGRKGGGAFEGGGVPGGEHPFSPPGWGVTLLPCYPFLDGAQDDIAALAPNVAAQGGRSPRERQSAATADVRKTATAALRRRGGAVAIGLQCSAPGEK